MDPSSSPKTPKSWRTSRTKWPAHMLPFSLHPQSTVVPSEPEQDIFSTTILASNIHCASCVTHIEEVLSRLEIITVSIRIVSNEVHILHSSTLAPSTICETLSDEAFEVFSAITVDKTDNIVSELSFPATSDDLLEGSLNRLSLMSCAGNCFPTSPAHKQTQHLENCAACRSKEKAAGSPEFNLKEPKVAQDEKVGEEEDQMDKSERETKRNASPKSDRTPLRQDFPSMDYQTASSKPNTEWKLALSVAGMTCATCSGSVTDALRALPEVKAVNVNLMSNSATVEFVGPESLSEKMMETIDDLGYKATISTVTALVPTMSRPADDSVDNRATLAIEGMTCATCVNAIERGLRQLSFIKDVKVSLMSNSAVVLFEDFSNLDKIVEAVEDIGFGCAVNSCEAANPEADNGSAARTIQIQVNGMYCEHCPEKTCDALKTKYGSSVEVVTPPTQNFPVMTITYTPAAPEFTIRNILATIDGVELDITASIYHPPSIEERSKEMENLQRNRILIRLAFSGIVVIPTFFFGVLWMTLVPEHDKMRQWAMTPVWAGNVTRSEWALAILASLVYFLAANYFHKRALKEIRAMWRPGSKVPMLRRFYRFGSMNLLICAGTTVAYVASWVQLGINATSSARNSNTTTYFDSVVFLTFFILVGRYLEAFSRSKTSDAISMLRNLKPDKAILVSQDEESERSGKKQSKSITVDADLLEVGDHVIVPHGSSPPADGIIISGEGKFDESSLTGESRSVSKTIDNEVYVGTINSGNPITMKVTKTGGTSMLDQIVSVVREGQSKRAPVERIADIITGYFVPIITFLAIFVWLLWFALGQSGTLSPRYLDNQTGGWAFWSLEFAIALFVVACPCGIGLAAPTALYAGIGLAAKHGILVRGGGEAFQEAPYLDAIVFDKTGTLTEGGELKVTDHETFTTEADEQTLIWTMISALEEQSTHPIARAIVSLAASQPTTPLTVTSITEAPGLGLHGSFTQTVDSTSNHHEAAIGSLAHITSLLPSPLSSTDPILRILSTWQSQSKSIAVFASRLVVTSDGLPKPWAIKAIFATSDPVRPSAAPAIATLKARGLKVYMLSGDNPATATAVAGELGIEKENVFAGVLPTEKAEKIRWLQRTLVSRRGHRRARKNVDLEQGAGPSGRNGAVEEEKGSGASVAFVGDGINDAPALLASTVSVSLSTGSPIALTSSSFVLLSSDLTSIPRLLDISRRVFRRIKINFGWALVYNAVLIPVAGGALFFVHGGGWKLSPVWAALAMALSSVSVVTSSLALKWERWMFWRKD